MKQKFRKRPAWILIACAWLFLFSVAYIFTLDFSKPKEEISLGLTFSQKYTRDTLHLDWKKVYSAILDDLRPKHLRLIAYWNELETAPGTFYFPDLDWQIEQARKHNASVILAVGQRAPRWAECHIPTWARALSADERNRSLLAFMATIVERYKEEPSLVMWQVENEPLLTFFGDCEPLNRDLFKTEVTLVHTLDPHHLVMTTASGEFDNWSEAAGYTDVVGVSLYRVISKKLLGTIFYPLPPAFYYWRAHFASHPDNIFISELQAEPWTATPITSMTKEEYIKQMNPAQLKENVAFARATGLTGIYLWGAEWWYWLKDQKNDSSMWSTAQELFGEYTK